LRRPQGAPRLCRAAGPRRSFGAQHVPRTRRRDFRFHRPDRRRRDARSRLARQPAGGTARHRRGRGRGPVPRRFRADAAGVDPARRIPCEPAGANAQPYPVAGIHAAEDRRAHAVQRFRQRPVPVRHCPAHRDPLRSVDEPVRLWRRHVVLPYGRAPWLPHRRDRRCAGDPCHPAGTGDASLAPAARRPAGHLCRHRGAADRHDRGRAAQAYRRRRPARGIPPAALSATDLLSGRICGVEPDPRAPGRRSVARLARRARALQPAGAMIALFLGVARQCSRRMQAQWALFACINVALDILSIMLLRSALVVLIAGAGAQPWLGRLMAVPGHDGSAIAVLLGLTFALFLAKSVLLGVWTRRLVRQLAREQAALGCRLFDRYLRRPFLEARTKVELKHNLDFASRQVVSQILFPGLLMISELVVLVAIALYLLVEAPVMTIALGLWTVAVAVYFRSSVAQHGRAAGQQTRKAAQRMSRTSLDAFNELVSIRLQAREGFFVERFRREALRFSDAFATEKFFQQLPKYLTETLFAGSLFVWFGALWAIGLSQTAIVSTLTLYASAALRFL